MSSAQSLQNADSTSQQSVTRRLRSELMALMVDTPSGISAFPEGDNMFIWSGTISGVNGTVYEGLTYKMRLTFPSGYPFKAPQVHFLTPCFHPNVDQHGNICLDILKENWSACYSVKTILLSIQSLLGEPNNDSPLNGHAASLWSDSDAFRRKLLALAAEKPLEK